MNRACFIGVLMIVVPFCIDGQELTMKFDFAVRDFYFNKDSSIYLKKRDLHVESQNLEKTLFLGGYGLKMFYDEGNRIITASNELVRNVASVRFFNKNSEKQERVYFYENAKIIDFIVMPEINIFVLSLTNKKIVFINYEEKSRFRKVIEIDAQALSRKLIHKDGDLFFATDHGQIYKYSLKNYNNTLIYETNDPITDFNINQTSVVYTTINNKIVKFNLSTKEKKEIKLQNNFVNTFIQLRNNNLICGSWNGSIYLVDDKDFKIKKELNYHERSILKISKINDSIFYSSSLDKTIKKWHLY